MTTKLEWALWPADSFGTARDEFIVGFLRFQLSRSVLTVALENGQSDQGLRTEAEELADDYVRRLATYFGTHVQLLTLSDLAAMPAWATPSGAPPGLRAEDPSLGRHRLAAAIRRARNDILPASEPTPRQCNDYIQNARDHEADCLPELYKMVETIENAFGGEAAAISALSL